MIVVENSALVAIAFGEPERDDFVQVIQRAGKALICTVSALDARMVVHGRPTAGNTYERVPIRRSCRCRKAVEFGK